MSIKKTRALEIYADLLLREVFVNLFESSLCHGKQVTSVTIRCADNGDNLVMIYEDTSIGIQSGDKTVLFTGSPGKHTGLRLFLIREILANTGITGISITDTGEPGAGARFEILIPRGKYRFAAASDEMIAIRVRPDDSRDFPAKNFL